MIQHQNARFHNLRPGSFNAEREDVHYGHSFKQACAGRLETFNNGELGYMALMASKGRLNPSEGLILGANLSKKSGCRAILLPFYH